MIRVFAQASFFFNNKSNSIFHI